MQPIPIVACLGEFLPLLSSSFTQYEALPNESGVIFLNIGRQYGFVPFQINSATVIIH